MRKVFVLLIVLFSPLLFSKYEIYLKLDKILNEAEIDQAMKSPNGESFFDSMIDITWNPQPEGFAFELINKSKTALAIIWDESSFINENGTSSKVINSGTKLIDKAQSIPPTNIPLFAKVVDSISPIDYWYFGHAKKLGYGSAINKWRNTPIWDSELKDKEFEKIKNIDLIYRIVLAVKNADQIIKYHFFFKAAARRI